VPHLDEKPQILSAENCYSPESVTIRLENSRPGVGVDRQEASPTAGSLIALHSAV
jgi:hypothetical protein